MTDFDPETHCHKCGEPKWEHRGLFEDLGYCKRCLVRGGGQHGVTVDFDKLVAAVGREAAGKVLAAGTSTNEVL